MCPSHDGGGPPVPLLLGHIGFIRGQSLGVVLTSQEVQNISVYTSSHSSSKHIQEHPLGELHFMEQNITPTVSQPLTACSVMMLHVLYATLQHVLPRSPSQPGHHVLLHGRGSTTATSWVLKDLSFRSRVPICIDTNAETIAGNTHLSFRSRVPICIDTNAETIAGNTHGNFKSVLKFIETTCIGISCPPFIDGLVWCAQMCGMHKIKHYLLQATSLYMLLLQTLCH